MPEQKDYAEQLTDSLVNALEKGFASLRDPRRPPYRPGLSWAERARDGLENLEKVFGKDHPAVQESRRTLEAHLAGHGKRLEKQLDRYVISVRPVPGATPPAPPESRELLNPAFLDREEPVD